jgi:regulator of replication initiation timing
MVQLKEFKTEIDALIRESGQMRKEQARLRKILNDSSTYLAGELLFLHKVTRSLKKADRALDWTTSVMQHWQMGLAQ